MNDKTTDISEYVGHLYVSSNGQLVVDKHVSDAEHLLASSDQGSQPLYGCRMYIDDLIPEEWRNKPVKLTVFKNRITDQEVIPTFTLGIMITRVCSSASTTSS